MIARSRLNQFCRVRSEEFTGQTYPLIPRSTHQSRAKGHDASEHARQSTGPRRSDGVFRAGNLRDQRANLLRGAFLAKEREDGAYGFFGNSLVNSGLCSQIANELVHEIAPCPPVTCRIFVCDFILSVCAANYKRESFLKPQFGWNPS